MMYLRFLYVSAGSSPRDIEDCVVVNHCLCLLNRVSGLRQPPVGTMQRNVYLSLLVDTDPFVANWQRSDICEKRSIKNAP